MIDAPRVHELSGRSDGARAQWRRARCLAPIPLILCLAIFSWCDVVLAQDDSFPPITYCGAPLSPGSVIEMKDARGFLIGRAKGVSAARVEIFDKYGRRRATIAYSGHNCEIRDSKGILQYRGKWR